MDDIDIARKAQEVKDIKERLYQELVEAADPEKKWARKMVQRRGLDKALSKKEQKELRSTLGFGIYYDKYKNGCNSYTVLVEADHPQVLQQWAESLESIYPVRVNLIPYVDDKRFWTANCRPDEYYKFKVLFKKGE